MRTAVAVALAAVAAVDLSAQQASTLRLSLHDAVELAARQNLSVMAARAIADQATARVTQRRADLLPSISASILQAGRTVNTATFGLPFPPLPGGQPIFDPDGQIVGPVNSSDVRARVSQPILDLAARGRTQGSRTAAGASEADVAVAADLAGSAAAVGYVRALRAREELEARLADSILVAGLLRIAQDLLSGGVGVALDVTRAEAQLAAVRAQLVGARASSERTKLELLRTLGASLDAVLVLTDSLDDAALGNAQAPTIAAATETALVRRPDLRAADARLASADAVVRAIRAERLPSLVAFGDRGIVGKNYDHLLGTYNWGIQLSIPILDGFRREGRITESQSQHREIELRREDLRQQVLLEVRLALLDLEAARDQVETARTRLALAEREVAQSRERFAAGFTGSAEVISASLVVNGARTGLLDALAARLLAVVGLERAQGTLAARQRD